MEWPSTPATGAISYSYTNEGFRHGCVEPNAVRAEVAQMVERAPEKGEAVGSLPTLGTIN